MIEVSQLRSLAEIAATDAGALLLKKWQRPSRIELKGFRDWVTDADYESQQLITRLIVERYPDHGFLTEEEGHDLNESGPILWIIDPVDGTTNFGRRLPVFCISIGVARRVQTTSKSVLDDGYELVAGAVFDPMRNELFSGGLGQGATLNGQSIQVSQTEELSETLFGVDWSRTHHLRQAMVNSVAKIANQVHTIRAIGSAALGLAWVAAGRLDAYANMSLGPWDVAAASVLIREAGGSLTTLDGANWRLTSQGCLASNGHLHQPIRSKADFFEAG